MASSSDNEFQLRRLFVHGVPPKTRPSALASFFGVFGAVAHVHNSKHGYAFVTFEEEEAASRALAANGDVFQGKTLSVEFSHSTRHPPQPLIGARRVVHFPRPFRGRGGGGGNRGGASTGARSALAVADSSSSGTCHAEAALPHPRLRSRGVHYPQQPHQQQQHHHHVLGPLQPVRGGGKGSTIVKGYRQRGAGGPGNERRAQIFPHHVKVVHSPDFHPEVKPGKNIETEDGKSELGDNYRKLFSFEYYPHIAKAFFVGLDATSLMRCKLVCKEWCHSIQRYVEGSPRIRAQLLQRWKTAECSFFPVTPSMYCDQGKLESNSAAGSGSGSGHSQRTEEKRDRPKGGDISANIPDSSYRNVLSLKCDETEIMLAVDNGNVEIYDRRSLRLKTLLVGQFASSPTSLDFDSDVILVGYTCGFRRLNRKFASSWNIYDRSTKALLHSVERFNDDDVRIGFDGHLYVTTNCAVFSVQRIGADAKASASAGSATLKTRKVFATHEVDIIEAFDLDKGHGIAVGVVRQNETPEKRLIMRVWQKPDFDTDLELESPPADFMTRLKRQFLVLEDYASRNDDFVELKCKCLSVQLRYPMCMCFFSNAFGYFEYFEDRGRPYSLLAFYNVESETCLRVVRIDEGWMRRHEVVPYDYDSGVLSARFSRDHLVLGFGSFSNRRDGGIALFSMSEVLAGFPESDMTVTKVPAPFYHRTGWDGHTGGVSALHVDAFQLVAVNSCVHQVSTRCIEGGDESKKDNVIVYDFWSPGKDLRR